MRIVRTSYKVWTPKGGAAADTTITVFQMKGLRLRKKVPVVAVKRQEPCSSANTPTR